jgi:hypothetical protein
MKIRHVGAEFLHTDGQADKRRRNRESLFRNFASVPKHRHCTCKIRGFWTGYLCLVVALVTISDGHSRMHQLLDIS